MSQEDPLEKEIATHSSILAWDKRRQEWTEEPGRLPSMGLQQSQTCLNKNNNKESHRSCCLQVTLHSQRQPASSV